MVNKTSYISSLAKGLINNGKTITFDELAIELNKNGFLTSYGTVYNGGRGVAKLVDAVYHRLKLKSEKKAVAHAFTNSNGEFAYNL